MRLGEHFQGLLGLAIPMSLDCLLNRRHGKLGTIFDLFRHLIGLVVESKPGKGVGHIDQKSASGITPAPGRNRLDIITQFEGA